MTSAASAAESPAASASDHRLTLVEILDALIADGLAPREEAEKFKTERRYFKGDVHPLIVIAEQRWKSAAPPHRTLDLDTLTQWLARWCGLRLSACRSAQDQFRGGNRGDEHRLRHALSHPAGRSEAARSGDRDGGTVPEGVVSELAPILRKDIRRVIGSPDDLPVIRSSSTTWRSRSRGRWGVAIPRQAFPISSSWLNWARPTSSSTPTTSISSASSTGCGSTPSSSAPPTSISNRGANSASSAFAWMACCTRFTSCR